MSLGINAGYKNPTKFGSGRAPHDDEALTRLLASMGSRHRRQPPTTSSSPPLAPAMQPNDSYAISSAPNRSAVSSPAPQYEHRMVLATAPPQEALSFTPAGEALMSQYSRPPLSSNPQPPYSPNLSGALVARPPVQSFHYPPTSYTPPATAPHDSSYTIRGDNLSHPGYLVLEDDSRIDQLKRRSHTAPTPATTSGNRIDNYTSSDGEYTSENEPPVQRQRAGKKKTRRRSGTERAGDGLAKLTRRITKPLVGEKNARAIAKYGGSFLTGNEEATRTGSKLSDDSGSEGKTLIRRSQTDRPRKREWSPHR